MTSRLNFLLAGLAIIVAILFLIEIETNFIVTADVTCGDSELLRPLKSRRFDGAILTPCRAGEIVRVSIFRDQCVAGFSHFYSPRARSIAIARVICESADLVAVDPATRGVFDPTTGAVIFGAKQH
jgi:hypothetical protein